MTPIIARNVSCALPLGVDYLLNYGVRESSRAGDVIVAPTPVMTRYECPHERVVFSAVRDANPFFHLVEAMWMLAGRNDSHLINKYVHDFGLRYAEDGIVWGAYGYRWLKFFDYNQLNVVVNRLKADPCDRRVVLSMWSPSDDLKDTEHAQSHLERDGRKDIPCNTHVYFRIQNDSLEMTVCCRSNDIIWGAYGANAVHFSFLQEYLAARIGVAIGYYYQLSNNYHAYVSEINKLKLRGHSKDLYLSLQDERYRGGHLELMPLLTYERTFNYELDMVLRDPLNFREYSNPFLGEVVKPAMLAHELYKLDLPCDEWLEKIKAEDWRMACSEWITRRRASRGIRAEADKSLATTPGQG